MPNGVVHGRATKTLAVGSLMFVANYPWLWPVPLGILTGLWIEPDLDLIGWTASEGRIQTAFGRPLGLLWHRFWWPYARLSKHRGLSHMPVVGTLIRVAYLLWIPLVALVAFVVADSLQVQPLLSSGKWLGAMGLWLGGLMASDSLHRLFDWVATEDVNERPG